MLDAIDVIIGDKPTCTIENSRTSKKLCLKPVCQLVKRKKNIPNTWTGKVRIALNN